MKYILRFLFSIAKILAFTLTFGLVSLAIMQPLYILRENEISITTRLGKIERTENTAGLKYKIPFIENVQIFPKNILRWDGEPQRIPTGGEEKQLIWIDTTARWKIVDVNQFYTAIKTMNRASTIINAAIEPAVRGVIAKYPLLEIIRSSNDPIQRLSDGILTPQDATDNTTYKITKGRKIIENEIIEVSNQNTKDNGIEIVDVLIRKIGYDPSLIDSVHNRMISERQQVAEEQRSTGIAEKTEILGSIEKEKLKLLSEAKAEAAKIKAEGDHEAAKIYANAYSKNVEFYKFWQALESYKATLKDKRKIFSTDMDFFKYLHNKK
ncbi:protease modulator HflC [Borrelia hermsii]|uniref:Protein HflC n=3 Tax=Borrelia hermsii TaxID=140 RepID=A0AAN0X642_BORHE|nr:protease modulator HflC [Borrelia hermsii]AAX16720.1 protease activity modulator HflC [Borrelia hermsii DAH]AJW73022.1 membane protease HflC [Borrelia hermsii CC1]AMR75622.1 Protease activity modulator HflC [Borrelia hermsii]ANA43018.1 protease modulator HflC [Borrelia hermsii HS1]UCP01233.1 protease modulator HflC [Borrelia hermsii]